MPKVITVPNESPKQIRQWLVERGACQPALKWSKGKSLYTMQLQKGEEVTETELKPLTPKIPNVPAAIMADWLLNTRACSSAREGARGKNLFEIWRDCQNYAWMYWLAYHKTGHRWNYEGVESSDPSWGTREFFQQVSVVASEEYAAAQSLGADISSWDASACGAFRKYYVIEEFDPSLARVLPNQSANDLRTELRHLGACWSAMRWSKGKDLRKVWATCDNHDWMRWLVQNSVTRLSPVPDNKGWGSWENFMRVNTLAKAPEKWAERCAIWRQNYVIEPPRTFKEIAIQLLSVLNPFRHSK